MNPKAEVAVSRDRAIAQSPSQSINQSIDVPWPDQAHCSPNLPGSSDSSATVSTVARATGVYHHTWLIFTFLVEMGFHHVDQVGFELQTSDDPPASADAGL